MIFCYSLTTLWDVDNMYKQNQVSDKKEATITNNLIPTWKIR